jgi:hypothetical protein
MTRYLRLNYVYDKLASMERQFLGGSLQVMCVGIAGTGAGTRIGGHLRYGGGKLRQRHRRYITVAMTNEYRTSRTCCYCFQPVIRPRSLYLAMANGEPNLSLVAPSVTTVLALATNVAATPGTVTLRQRLTSP